jgi:hypothetical protein
VFSDTRDPEDDLLELGLLTASANRRRCAEAGASGGRGPSRGVRVIVVVGAGPFDPRDREARGGHRVGLLADPRDRVGLVLGVGEVHDVELEVPAASEADSDEPVSQKGDVFSASAPANILEW